MNDNLVLILLMPDFPNFGHVIIIFQNHLNFYHFIQYLIAQIFTTFFIQIVI